MLADAQNLTTLFLYPWLLVPGIFVIIAVPAFQLVGDGCAPPPTPTSSRRTHPPRWARGVAAAGGVTLPDAARKRATR